MHCEESKLDNIPCQIVDVQHSSVGRGSGLRQTQDQIPAYRRPSRDIQFNYVNTAKKEGEKFEVLREEPSAQEILETLARLVSPEDLEDLYIR